VDIVKEQIRIAAGEKLSIKQEDVVARGHAIECRINAEDPFKMFMPSPGTITKYAEPSLPWVRVDSASYTGYAVLPFYDSLLAKLVCWGRTREEAIARTKLALKEFTIDGLKTTIPFHQLIMNDDTFLKGEIYTGYVENEFKKNLAKPPAEIAPASTNGGASTAGGAEEIERTAKREFEVVVNQKRFNVGVQELVAAGTAPASAPAAASAAKPAGATATQARPRPASAGTAGGGTGEIRSAMHGLVKQINVNVGDKVTAGQKVLIFEAMKMESEITAPKDGTVTEIKVKAGETVESKTLLMVIGE
jgi:acetyl-CoA/propionyl-CoA carboxylase biotin carboxyl carrier protein